MFEELEKINTRPKPFEFYTASEKGDAGKKVNNLIYIKSYLLFYERPHKFEQYRKNFDPEQMSPGSF
jgi:hypothetical protein